MDKDLQQKIPNYIAALEKDNEQLIFALKRCVELWAHIRPPTSDQEDWQSILDDIEGIIKVGERIVGEKPLH